MPLRKVEGSWQEKLKAVDFWGAVLTLLASSLVIVSVPLTAELFLLSPSRWDFPGLAGSFLGALLK